MKRRFRNAVLASALGVIALAAAPTLPAFAVNNFQVTWVGMPNNATTNYPCDHGTNYSWVNPEPIEMNNNCDVRVWIYELQDQEGYNLCLNPGQVNFIPHRSYLSAYISTNTAACGS